MNPDELTKLQKQVKNLELRISEVETQNSRKQSQLTSPLDTYSANIIQNYTIYPVSVRLKNTDAATAANYGHFFIADSGYTILSIDEMHGTAGNDAGSVTLNIEKLTGTQSLGNGTSLLTTAFNLKATANTVQYGNITATGGANSIIRGDRLALKLSGTPTTVANLIVTVYIQPL